MLFTRFPLVALRKQFINSKTEHLCSRSSALTLRKRHSFKLKHPSDATSYKNDKVVVDNSLRVAKLLSGTTVVLADTIVLVINVDGKTRIGFFTGRNVMSNRVKQVAKRKKKLQQKLNGRVAIERNGDKTVVLYQR